VIGSPDDAAAVLLTGCDKSGAMRAQERLAYALREYVNREKMGDAVEWRIGCAVYPADGATDDELIRQAKKSF